MAEVFVGSMEGVEGFSRKVAIKRVLPGFSDHAGFARLFVTEAQISSQLVHPNIVSVLDFDRDALGQLFLVMELVDGKDLDALLGTGMLPLPVVIFVIAEILRGLGFAHDLPAGSGVQGIVHRDISPHNVLLSWEGAVKLSDFGIAKVRAASHATASVYLKGKPAYMSPEQINGQRLDGRSDLFAVGVMLWEMLVGQCLFAAEDTGATLTAVLYRPIPRPRLLRPDLPKDLERVAMKLLERDLPARYATAELALADLMNCADAPRGGREGLIAVLAERFPDSAPVRQSVARARSHGTPPSPLPAVFPPYARPLLIENSAKPGSPPALAQPGLGTVMSARTRTRAALPRVRLAQVLIVFAVMIASAVVSFAIVSAMRGKPAPRSHSGIAPGSRPGAAPEAMIVAAIGTVAGLALEAALEAAPEAAPGAVLEAAPGAAPEAPMETSLRARQACPSRNLVQSPGNRRTCLAPGAACSSSGRSLVESPGSRRTLSQSVSLVPCTVGVSILTVSLIATLT